MPRYLIEKQDIEDLQQRLGNDFHAINPLPPVVYQVGGTCGIYALDRALDVQGIPHAKPRKRLGDEDAKSAKEATGAEKIQYFGSAQPVSMREIAKRKNFSRIGEILSAAKLRDLAISCGATNPEVKDISTADALWNLVVQAVKSNHTVIVPYNADDEIDPVAGPDDLAHWVIIIGGCVESGNLRSILTTHSGRYDLVPLDTLWAGNDSLRTWKASKWFKTRLAEVQSDGSIKNWTNQGREGNQDDEAFEARRKALHINYKKQAEYPKYERKSDYAIWPTDVDIGITLRHKCVLV